MPYPGAAPSVNIDSLLAGEDLANGRQLVASQANEQLFTLPTLNNAFVDSGTLVPLGKTKTIYVVVTTALTWVTSGQATIKLYVGRTPFTAAVGAATQLDVAHPVKGAAANLGASGTTLALNSLFAFSPVDLADLQWAHPFVGVELQFPSALTAGALSIYLESLGV